MRFPGIKFDTILVDGGLDQVTPTLSLPNGFCKLALNFEIGVNGGARRIEGYERFDGQTPPSDTSIDKTMVTVASFTNTPNVGDEIEGSISGATATIAIIDGLYLGLTKITGTFEEEEITTDAGATVIGTIDDAEAGPATPQKYAQFLNAVADIYRADIEAPPGSGAIRGISMLGDTVYIFKNNLAADGVDIYKSSASGWVQVPLYWTVSFDTGAVATPSDGDTLTQGGVTSEIKRVVLESGSFAGSDAAGRFIIEEPTGGSFVAGAATIGTTTVNLLAADAQITILPNGRYEIITENFSGFESEKKLYGCDGINKAFEFDGDVYVPINSTATIDNPSHIVKFRDFLILGIGTSLSYSKAALPYIFTSTEGGGSIPTGDYVTGFLVMPGDNTVSALAVYNRSKRGILYGTTSTDFNFVQYDIGLGAVPFSLQNMRDSLAFDDRGLESIKTTFSFGNFTQSTFTDRILPYIQDHVGKVSASVLNREKSQYRLFFNNGDALYCTIVNGKYRGAMPITLGHIPYCTYEGKNSDGENVIFFGATNGMVYQMDRGTSFDGDPIEFFLSLNYTHSRSPRVKKRYRKSAFEIAALNFSYVELSIGYSLGYDSIEYEQSDLIDYASFLSDGRFDNLTWDNFFFDSKNLSPLEVETKGSGENIAFFVYGESDYIAPFIINSIIIHYSD